MNKNLFVNSNDPDHLFYYQFLKNDSFQIGIMNQMNSNDSSLMNLNMKKINKLLMFLNNDYYYFNPYISNNLQVFTLSKNNDKYFVEKFFSQ